MTYIHADRIPIAAPEKIRLSTYALLRAMSQVASENGGVCNASVQTLCDFVRISKTTYHRITNILVDHGLLWRFPVRNSKWKVLCGLEGGETYFERKKRLRNEEELAAGVEAQNGTLESQPDIHNKSNKNTNNRCADGDDFNFITELRKRLSMDGEAGTRADRTALQELRAIGSDAQILSAVSLVDARRTPKTFVASLRYLRGPMLEVCRSTPERADKPKPKTTDNPEPKPDRTGAPPWNDGYVTGMSKTSLDDWVYDLSKAAKQTATDVIEKYIALGFERPKKFMMPYAIHWALNNP